MTTKMISYRSTFALFGLILSIYVSPSFSALSETLGFHSQHYICPGPGNFPIKGGDCKSYNKCLTNGMRAIGRGRCPVGMLFNPVHRVCAPKDQVDCLLCAVNGDRVDPESQDHFIRCVDGVAFRLQCYPGQVYDPRMLYCHNANVTTNATSNGSEPIKVSAADFEPLFASIKSSKGSQSMASASNDGKTNAMASSDTGNGTKSTVFAEGLQGSQAISTFINDTASAKSASSGAMANAAANDTGVYVGSSADGTKNSSAISRSKSLKAEASSLSDETGSKSSVFSSVVMNATESPLGQSRANTSMLNNGTSSSEAEVANREGMNASAFASGNGTSQAGASFNKTSTAAKAAAEGVAAESVANVNGSTALSRSEGTSNATAAAGASNNATEVLADTAGLESSARGSMKSNETATEVPPGGNGTGTEAPAAAPGANDFKTDDIAPDERNGTAGAAASNLSTVPPTGGSAKPTAAPGAPEAGKPGQATTMPPEATGDNGTKAPEASGSPNPDTGKVTTVGPDTGSKAPETTPKMGRGMEATSAEPETTSKMGRAMEVTSAAPETTSKMGRAMEGTSAAPETTPKMGRAMEATSAAPETVENVTSKAPTVETTAAPGGGD